MPILQDLSNNLGNMSTSDIIEYDVPLQKNLAKNGRITTVKYLESWFFDC